MTHTRTFTLPEPATPFPAIHTIRELIAGLNLDHGVVTLRVHPLHDGDEPIDISMDADSARLLARQLVAAADGADTYRSRDAE